MEEKTRSFTNRTALTKVFEETLQSLSVALPNGIVRQVRPNSTPLVLFEAVSVGVADIVTSGRVVDPAKLAAILDHDELKTLTTGATNSLPKLVGRIDYVSNGASA